MVTFKIASRCLNRIIDRVRPFVGRTADIAIVAIPSAPHRPGFAFFDVYRIPDTPFGVIVLMDFLNRHRTSFRLQATFASNPGADKFTVCRSRFAVRSSRFTSSGSRVTGLRLGAGERIGAVGAIEPRKMGLMRPMGLMEGGQEPPDSNDERRTVNGEP